jgi:hypothetical protein
MGNGYLADLIFAPCLDMSTTIVRIYTPEGFVIAADGRNYNADTKTIVSDAVQKIFPVELMGGKLAYTLTGTCGITPRDSNEVIFDLLPWIHESIRAAANDKHKSLWHFAQAVSEVIIDLPEPAKASVLGDEQPTMIFFDGYYDGRAKRAHITIFYDGQVPEVSTEELLSGFPVGVGSSAVNEILRDPNGALAKYRTPSLDLSKNERTSLEHAIDAARSWMSAQCSPEAQKIDPRCISMGGQVLMATITFRDGLRWIPYRPL